MKKEDPNGTFIKMYRKIWDNAISTKPNYFAVWMYLLSHANAKQKEVIINNEKMIIHRGSFIGSTQKISEQFELSKGTVHYILKYLEVERMIERKIFRRFTLFKIKNYDRYNPVERTFEHGLNTNETPVETTKKDKKGKKDNIVSDKSETVSDKKKNWRTTWENMRKDKQPHIRLVRWYCEKKKIKPISYENMQAIVSRNVRAAKAVATYSKEETVEVMNELIKWDSASSWTLETVQKFLEKGKDAVKQLYANK